MFDYLFFVAALSVPFFIKDVKTHRKGLVTGLFLSLLYWGKLNPILAIIPLFSALCVFFAGRRADSPKKNAVYVKNPSLPMLLVFIVSMAIFCAFEDSFVLYGNYVGVSSDTLAVSGSLDKLAFLIGPLLLGNWCDRKGPFGAAIFLTLLSEISVWCAGNGHSEAGLFIAGSFFMRLCTSGFFVVLPIVIYTYFGKNRFSRVYPVMALITAAAWTGGRLVYLHKWSVSYSPGSFMISLSLLTVVSALFLFLAWQRRFTLVMEKKLQKTS